MSVQWVKRKQEVLHPAQELGASEWLKDQLRNSPDDSDTAKMKSSSSMSRHSPRAHFPRNAVSLGSRGPSLKALHVFPHDQHYHTSGKDSRISSTPPSSAWLNWDGGGSLGFSYLSCKLTQRWKPILPPLTRPSPEFLSLSVDYPTETSAPQFSSGITTAHVLSLCLDSMPPLTFLSTLMPSGLSIHRFHPNSLPSQGCPNPHSYSISYISPGSTGHLDESLSEPGTNQVSSYFLLPTVIPISSYLQGPHISNTDMAIPYRPHWNVTTKFIFMRKSWGIFCVRIPLPNKKKLLIFFGHSNN